LIDLEEGEMAIFKKGTKLRKPRDRDSATEPRPSSTGGKTLLEEMRRLTIWFGRMKKLKPI